ncbi:GntP family permease [Phytohalomonas tamaricis]|uniref:GntP family permease n=1 Tax=Phytohalomonas tamaricis TaxID=2081032 RepID=UPI000D0AEC25|nr:gluconate:H+ symporter [Phytohalomonas tamaricis]
MSHDTWLLVSAALSIVVLLMLVIRWRMHAFVALLLVSIVVGLITGMPLGDIVDTIQAGMGGTLGFVATVVGLGAMFGAMLEVSGGVDRLASTLMRTFGEGRAQWALSIAGFLIAIPVFLDVAFVILVPLIYALTRRTGKPLLFYGIPLVAGLGVTHGFIPPTPGPIAVADLLGANIGSVILFGAIAGIPAMIVAGPIFGSFISKRIQTGIPDYIELPAVRDDYADLPSFKMIFSILILPLVLILLNTASGMVLDEGNLVAQVLSFVGDPIVALLIATLLSFAALGTKRGLSRDDVMKVATKSLEPVGLIILVTGAGGAFKQTLIDSGVGDVMGDMMASSALPPLVLAFLIALGVRVIQGSLTVAMITAAGLMAPLVETMGLEGPILALMVIAIASGATALSHVNDSGFWLVSRYFGLTEAQTLKSWTVMETIIGIVGLLMCLLIAMFL